MCPSFSFVSFLKLSKLSCSPKALITITKPKTAHYLSSFANMIYQINERQEIHSPAQPNEAYRQEKSGCSKPFSFKCIHDTLISSLTNYICKLIPFPYKESSFQLSYDQHGTTHQIIKHRLKKLLVVKLYKNACRDSKVICLLLSSREIVANSIS